MSLRSVGRVPAAGVAAVVLAASSAACGDEQPRESLPASSSPAVADAPREPQPRRFSALIDELGGCDVDHRGLFFDLGSTLALGRVRPAGDSTLSPVERGGDTWIEVGGKGFEASFVLPKATPIFAQLRIESLAAKRVSVAFDDLPLGQLVLERDKPIVVATPPTSAPVDAGEHTFTVRFQGGEPNATVRARVDWLRVGIPDELRTTYGPPVASDLVTPAAALDKVPHRALSLRVPSLVRCPLHVPAGAELRFSSGMLGSAKGELEVLVRADERPPVSLLRREVSGGQDAKWSDERLSLDAFAGQLVQLELRAPAGSTTGRVLFGDPEIVVPPFANVAAPEAQVAIVVVLSGVERELLPGYGRDVVTVLPSLHRFADRAATFLDHRAPTTVVPAAIASLLTGRLPLDHGLTDYGARLGSTSASLLARARRVGVETGFFTGVPHSFEPSGLLEGAERKVVSSPVSGDARDPIQEATDWIRETLDRNAGAKALALVHARGVHPPWPIAQKQLDALPPQNYTGELHPRRAAQQLAQLRRRKAGLDLSHDDRARLSAMMDVGLTLQDRAFGELLRYLETSGLEDRALVVVTSDVGSGLSTLFADAPPLAEQALELPLLVAFPGRAHAGLRVRGSTEVSDLSDTIAASLRIPVDREPRGLLRAMLDPSWSIRPRLASSGEERSLRLDRWVLRKAPSGRAAICDLRVDPTCTFDRRLVAPFVAQTLERALATLELEASRSVVPRAALELDDATLSALRVWGSMP